MAGVPTYDQPRVNPTGPNDARFQSPDTSGFAENGRQLSRFGATLEAAGEQAGKVFQHEQEKANDTAVIDAENKAREAAIKLTIDDKEGYANIQGGDVMDVDGKPLAVAYRERYQQQLRDITGSLKNDAQRRAFSRSAAALDQSFYAKAAEHEATEYRGWQQSVVKGSAELAGQEIALNYGDTDLIDHRLGTLDVSVAKLGQLQGASGNEIEALQNTARSTALTGAISAALDADDPAAAQTLFDRYKDKMLAPDKGKIETVLNREMTGKTALAIGDLVFNDLPGAGVDKPSVEKVFNALVNQESSGRAGVAGPPTRYGTAHGLTQVLDSTGAGIAKKLRIEWRPDLLRGRSQDARDYQMRLGRAYFEEGLQKYGGDFEKALMYYHGGPDEDNWGPKTRAYAQNVLSRAGAKRGGTVVPTLEDAIKVGRAALEATHPNAPYEMTRAVEDEISRRWTVHKAAADSHEEQALSTAMTQLLKNGGDVNAIDAKLRNAIPGDKWDSLLSFSSSVRSYAKGDRDPKHDDAMYNFALTNPQVLRDASDSAFLAKYAGHPKFEEIAKYRAQLRGQLPVGDGKNKPGDLNYATINRVIDNRLVSIGIDPKDDKAEGQIGAARRVLNGAIAGEQRRVGRQLTDAETESFIDKQFARPGVINTSWLGTRTPIPLFKVDVDHIPKPDLKQIDDALDRNGQPKTDANRLALYYAARGR